MSRLPPPPPSGRGLRGKNRREDGFRIILCAAVCAGVFLFGIAPAHAAVVFKQGVAGGNGFGGTSYGLSLPNASSTDTIIVLAQWAMLTGSSSITSITDTLGNTYTIATSTLSYNSNGGGYAQFASEVAYASGITGSTATDTVTIHFSNSTSNDYASLVETSPSLPDLVSVATSSTGTVSAGTVTTTANGEFGVAVGISNDNGVGSAYGAGAGWTSLQNTGGGSIDAGSEYQAQATAGTITGNFAYTSSYPWAASMAVFKANTSPPSISSFSGSPSVVASAGTSTLSWSVSNVSTVAISPGSVSTSTASGSVTVNPTSTTLYTLTATNANGTSTATTTVTVDSQAPSVPQNFTVSTSTSSSATLSWASSTDDISVSGYDVYRCTGSCTPTAVLATTTQTSYTDGSLSELTTYTYAVDAYDGAGNTSTKATSTAVTTPANPAQGIYITQNTSGSDTGADCANAHSAAWFNASADWSSTSTVGLIYPGTTVHLCGTFTGTAGSTMLSFQGGGVSSSPVTLYFEANAALTAPLWAGNPNGAIAMGTHNYVTIDGGTNGTLKATANGTGLTYASSTYGITGGGSHQTVQNMNIVNLYQRQPGGHELADGSTVQGIALSGDHALVQDNTIHDVGWAIIAEGDQATVKNNTIYHADHGTTMEGAHWYFYGNHVYNFSVWDSDNDAYHHDGVHCFASSTAGITQAAYVYNNRFDGSTGNNMNQSIFLEGGTSDTRCLIPGGAAYIFNNVFIGSGSLPTFGAGISGNASGTALSGLVANNTIVGASSTDSSMSALSYAYASSTTIENNAAGGTGALIYGLTSVSWSSSSSVDYNAYENCGSFNCFWIAGADTPIFSTYQSSTGLDAHSIASTTMADYFGLNAACAPGSVGASCTPHQGSPLIGAGANLTSLCIGNLTALCADINGVSRPSSGAWDTGAYQYVPEYFLASITGSDNATGTTSGTPWATMQHLMQSGAVYPTASSTVATSTKSMTFNSEVQITLGNGAVITIPSGTVMSVSSTQDFTGMAATSSVSVSDIPSGYKNLGAASMGFSSVSMTASQAVTINMPVDSSYNGNTLTIFRKDPGGSWTNVGTCTASSATCTFTTTHFSDFSVSTTQSSSGSSGGTIGVPGGGTPVPGCAGGWGTATSTQASSTPPQASASSVPTPPASPRSSPSYALETLQLKLLLLELQSLVHKAQSEGIPLPPGTASVLQGLAASPPTVPSFTRDLSRGSRGNDVLALQRYLAEQDAGPAARALTRHGLTELFGPLTQAALKEFQHLHGIRPAVGYFGPKTRAYIAAR